MSEFTPVNLGEQLVTEANRINVWATKRERSDNSNRGRTQRKLGQSLRPLLEHVRDKRFLIQAPALLMIDEDKNLLLNQGELTGEVVGLSFQTYPSVAEDGQIEQDRAGVVGIVATKSMYTPGFRYSSDAWDEIGTDKGWPNLVSREFSKYKDMDTLPTLIPFDSQPIFTEISNPFPLNIDTEEFSAHEWASTEFNLNDHLARVSQITQDRIYFDTVRDTAKIHALHREIEFINASCPYFQKPVTVTSNYMRCAHPDNPKSTLTLAGTASGILRKFIYEPYYPKGLPPKGTLQAVIYSPDTQQRVKNGEITPQDADLLPTTLKVPVDHSPIFTPIE